MGKAWQTIIVAPLLWVSLILSPKVPLFAREFTIPKRTLPRPNGFDLLVRAAKIIQKGHFPADPRQASLQQQRVWVRDNAASLKMLQFALRLPIVTPPIRGHNPGFRNWSQLRQLARLGARKSTLFGHDKNWPQAVRSSLDVIEMGARTQNGADTIGLLVSVSLQSIGRSNLWVWHAHAHAKTALSAVRRLSTIEAKTPAYTQIVSEEKWSGLSSIQGMITSATWKKFRRGDNKALSEHLLSPSDSVRLRRFSNAQIQRNFLNAMNQVIARSRLSFNHKWPAFPTPPDPYGAMAVTMETGPRPPLRFQYEQARVANRMLMVAFALQAYAQERRRYPNSLQELVPKYLQAVPRDTFASAKPLRYRRKLNRRVNTYVLHSVGPDGVDNGGLPMQPPKGWNKQWVTHL